MKSTSGCFWTTSREFYQYSQTLLMGGSSGPAPPGPWAWDLLIPALHSVVWAGGMINAFCFKADTSQIITYRCSRTFMWERQMRLRLSDSGATEDRKPQPARLSPLHEHKTEWEFKQGRVCLTLQTLLLPAIHFQPLSFQAHKSESSLRSGVMIYSSHTS